eukprot:2710945-Heterocapsa_arctica.AAC.1
MKSLANPKGNLGDDGTTCYVCGKSRQQHHQQRFCKAVDKVITKKGDRRGDRKGDKKGAKGLGKGKLEKKGNMPDYMVGTATRTPATTAQPLGI